MAACGPDLRRVASDDGTLIRSSSTPSVIFHRPFPSVSHVPFIRASRSSSRTKVWHDTMERWRPLAACETLSTRHVSLEEEVLVSLRLGVESVFVAMTVAELHHVVVRPDSKSGD